MNTLLLHRRTLGSAADSAWNTSMSKDFGSQRVEIPHLGLVLPSGSVTLETWANPYGNRRSVAFGNYSSGDPNTGGNNRVMVHLPWESGTVYWDRGNINNGGRIANGFGAYNQWNHYAFVADQTTSSMSVYINGQYWFGSNTYAEYVTTDESFFLGYWIDSYNHNYPGRLGEFRIWNYARTPAQTTADMNKTFTTGKPGLIGCWRLDDAVGAGGTILDRSGNNRHGILS